MVYIFKPHNNLQRCSEFNSVGSSPRNYATIYQFICIIVVGLYVINSRQKSSPYSQKSVHFEGCFGRIPDPCWGQMSGRYSRTVLEPSTSVEGTEEGRNVVYEIKRKPFILCLYPSCSMVYQSCSLQTSGNKIDIMTLPFVTLYPKNTLFLSRSKIKI